MCHYDLRSLLLQKKACFGFIVSSLFSRLLLVDLESWCYEADEW